MGCQRTGAHRSVAAGGHGSLNRLDVRKQAASGCLSGGAQLWEAAGRQAGLPVMLGQPPSRARFEMAPAITVGLLPLPAVSSLACSQGQHGGREHKAWYG